MNVKIDVDIAEGILKAYARRDRNQKRVYGILIGSVQGGNNYHVRNCVYGYIYESKDEETGTTEFKRLNDMIVSSVFNSFSSNFPGQSILGGFSTDSDPFPELFYLYNTINDIHSGFKENANKILVLIDPWHDSKEKIDYGTKAFNWLYQEEAKIMSYKKIDHSIVTYDLPGIDLHSNLSNKELIYTANKGSLTSENFTELIEEIKKSVDEELKFKINTHNLTANQANVLNLKKQLLLADKFLTVIDTYISNETNIDNELLHKIDFVTQEIENNLDTDELSEIVQKEFKQNQIIDYLTNLLNLQIKITEKINLLNI